MICEKCKANISDTTKFCPKCGTKVEIAKAKIVEKKLAENHKEKQGDMNICANCGTTNPLTAKFCKKDGTPLQKIPLVKPVEVALPEAPVKEMKAEVILKPEMEEASSEDISKSEKEKPVQEKSIPATPKAQEIQPDAIVPRKSAQITPDLKSEEKLEEKALENVLRIEKSKSEVPSREEAKPAAIVEGDTKSEIIAKPSIKEKVQPRNVVMKETEKRPSKTWVWLSILGLIVVFSGTGIYLYFSGKIGKISEDVSVSTQVSEPSQPSQLPEEVAKSPDLPQVTQQIEPEIEEPIPQPSKSEVVKPPIPPLQIPPVDFAKLEREINTSLRKRGLNDIYAEINKNLVATLTGTAKNRDEKNEALSIVGTHREIKEVRDDIQIKVVKLTPPSPPTLKVDPAKLEDGINRALRNMGVNGVIAEVNDDLQVTLKGTVTSPSDKGKAFEIANTFKDVKRIRDIIFVVEQ